MLNRICFVGNSITRAPNMLFYGWQGCWGMAAPQAAQDYVHLAQLAITAKQGSIPEILILGMDVVTWTPEYGAQIEAQMTAFGSDLVVAQFGDNAGLGTPDSYFSDAYACVRAGADVNTRIIALGIWHTEPEGDHRDRQILAACSAVGCEFVSLADLRNGNTVADAAIYSDAGVRWHPGAAGHLRIANRLLGAIYRVDYLGE